jgi:predicted proteasome-type protease
VRESSIVAPFTDQASIDVGSGTFLTSSVSIGQPFHLIVVRNAATRTTSEIRQMDKPDQFVAMFSETSFSFARLRCV